MFYLSMLENDPVKQRTPKPYAYLVNLFLEI